MLNHEQKTICNLATDTLRKCDQPEGVTTMNKAELYRHAAVAHRKAADHHEAAAKAAEKGDHKEATQQAQHAQTATTDATQAAAQATQATS